MLREDALENPLPRLGQPVKRAQKPPPGIIAPTDQVAERTHQEAGLYMADRRPADSAAQGEEIGASGVGQTSLRRLQQLEGPVEQRSTVGLQHDHDALRPDDPQPLSQHSFPGPVYVVQQVTEQDHVEPGVIKRKTSRIPADGHRPGAALLQKSHFLDGEIQPHEGCARQALAEVEQIAPLAAADLQEPAPARCDRLGHQLKEPPLARQEKRVADPVPETPCVGALVKLFL